jgi:outer membrane protein assembly factor BamD
MSLSPVRLAWIVAVTLTALTISACGSDDKDSERYVERPVQEIYNEAVGALRNEEYTRAAERFDDVERQHPYSVWAVKASLMAAFSHYQAASYEEAVLALDRFIQLHPGNSDIAYAYYLRALCFYEQISDVVRDQLNTEKALAALQEVVRRFPETNYARDARLKIDLTRDHLAGKEMDIGRYYLTRGHYLAAVRRFRRVVDIYETTTHIPEALHRLTEAYLALGLKTEATKAAAVLGHNYPGSDWYSDSYALVGGGSLPKPDKRGFLTRAFDWVF